MLTRLMTVSLWKTALPGKIMANRHKLLAIAIAAALLVGLLVAVGVIERRFWVENPGEGNTRPVETTAPPVTYPEPTWIATPWG